MTTVPAWLELNICIYRRAAPKPCRVHVCEIAGCTDRATGTGWAHLASDGDVACITQAIAADTSCWLDHLQLNQTTGLDLPGVKLRASEGLTAIDYLLPELFVWAKVIEALADLGYDPSMLVRLSYRFIECDICPIRYTLHPMLISFS